MSFDITQKIDTADKIQYNYYATSFYKNQYQNTIINSGYIKVPYTSKSNEPNLATLGNGYVTTNLYIVKPIHIIDEVSYDAEMIVEHRSLTNYNEPLYTCFLLKTDRSTPYNEIDQLIDGSEDTLLNLNSLMQSNTSIVFTNNLSKSALIVIFTTPIHIQTSLSGKNMKLALPFLSPYVNEYSIFRVQPILGEPIIEGLTSSETADDGSGIINPSSISGSSGDNTSSSPTSTPTPTPTTTTYPYQNIQ